MNSSFQADSGATRAVSPATNLSLCSFFQYAFTLNGEYENKFLLNFCSDDGCPLNTCFAILLPMANAGLYMVGPQHERTSLNHNSISSNHPSCTPTITQYAYANQRSTWILCLLFREPRELLLGRFESSCIRTLHLQTSLVYFLKMRLVSY